MNSNAHFPESEAAPTHSRSSGGRLREPILAAVVSWVLIGLGFLALKVLMHERPQFTGQPLRVSKVHLVQRAPSLVLRKASDDVSAVKTGQPARAEAEFEVRGRRDYRGLRTILDMSGRFNGRYWLTNRIEEPAYYLFKCPHPATLESSAGGGFASGLKLESSKPGLVENVGDAWYWSGRLGPGEGTLIQVSYAVSALRQITYRIDEPAGVPVLQHRVSFRRTDLPAMGFESSEGTIQAETAAAVWERADFLAPDFFSARIVEGRQLYTSFSQLLEIGPLVSFMFLAAVLAGILVRQPLTAIQVLTIGAGYGLYFPLILYLSARFSFPVALVVSAAVPGLLLVNYARWLLGLRLGVFGGAVCLALYQIFPTLAAFAGWNRGMVLLCLGTITLGLLIDLQNRALKRRVVRLAILSGLLAAGGGRADDVQLLVPAERLGVWVQQTNTVTQPLVAFEQASYAMTVKPQFVQVHATVGLQAIRGGDRPVSLFATPVHLSEWSVQTPSQEFLDRITLEGVPGLWVRASGRGTITLAYRAPIRRSDGRLRVQIPLLSGPPGRVELEAHRADINLVEGALWAKSTSESGTRYDIGVTGRGSLTLEWLEQTAEGPSALLPGDSFYGIGITESRNLTVVHSDGSCAHFAEYELSPGPTPAFQVQIPPGAQVVSVSVDGIEVNPPEVRDERCTVPLPERAAPGEGHRLSLRLACAPVRLGFLDFVDLSLPRVFQTVGTLEWIVAFPSGFDLEVIASGLETGRASADLPAFGGYGRVLASQPHLNLIKHLAPPGSVQLQLKYRQRIPRFNDGGP